MKKTMNAISKKWPDANFEIEDIRQSPITFRRWNSTSPKPTQQEIDQAVSEYDAAAVETESAKQKTDTAAAAAIEKIATKAGLSKEEKDALKERTKNEKQ